MCLLSLTACADTGFNKLTAPTVVEYSGATQEAAAREVLSGACPTLTTFLQDYCVMRDQSRVAKGLKPTCTKKP